MNNNLQQLAQGNAAAQVPPPAGDVDDGRELREGPATYNLDDLEAG